MNQTADEDTVENKTVDEITGVAEKLKRSVTFSSQVSRSDGLVQNKENTKKAEEITTEYQTYPRPSLKVQRPRTSGNDMINNNLPDEEHRTKSAHVIRNVYDINAYQQSWSPSDAQRKFNALHGDHVPDLRREPDLRITTNERRHHTPEAGNAPSYIFSGQYVS